MSNIKTVTVKQDEITDEISRLFDYEFDGTTTFTPPLISNLPDKFNIGLIVGPSGSGKTTLLNSFGQEENINWKEDKAIVSHFKNADDAKDRLSGVGFNSIPSWLRPYHVLSTGEKFRADLAAKLKNNAVIDEFTSVVDRNVAKSCSYALKRYVDKQNINNIVLASCHYDIIEWLQPDWVFDTNTGQLTRRGVERRPTINIKLIPCSSKAWALFSHHHYLSSNINKSSRCWLAYWNNNVVGFVSIIAFPNKNFKNAWRGHRTVVLPDYQGLGIGVRISDAIGELLIQHGYRYFSKTAHPRMGEYRNNSELWKPTSKNMKARKDYINSNSKKEKKYMHKHINRICYSHEYIGLKN